MVRRRGAKSDPVAPARVVKTLDRALSRSGVASRSQARELVAAGRVRVNGKVVRDPDEWVDPARDRLQVDGARVEAPEPLTLALYKPTGCLVTRDDPGGRRTVYELLPEGLPRLFPVGRLDLDTSGLLLMTNDSGLAETLTNPDFHVPKTYLVRASRTLTDAELETLRTGIDLADGPTRPARVDRLRETGGRTIFEITITEGRNRQVRRMVEAVGAKVLKLVRVAIGPLQLRGLAVGACRELGAEEIRSLRRAARPRAPRQS